MASDLDAGHAGHADVEQHDGRLQLADQRQRIGAVRAHAGDGAARQLGDEPLQPFARRQFVVDDEDAQGAAFIRCRETAR